MKISILIANLMLALLISISAATGSTTTTTTSVVSVAPPAPESLPLTKSDLLGYALASAKSGYTSIWSRELLASADENRLVSVVGNDADDVVKKLSDPTNIFKFKVWKATAEIYAYSGISDTFGYQLFQSDFQQIKTEQNGANLVLKFGSLNLKMAWVIPFHIKDVASARVEHVDANGNRWTEDLNVYNETLFFPTQDASATGTLIVSCYNPITGVTVETAYSTSTGVKMPGVSTSGPIVSTIENHVSGDDTGLASGASLNLIETIIPPATDGWSIVTPPSASFKLTSTPVGSTRNCVWTMVMVGTPEQLGTIQAWAYDPARVAADGTVEQIAGTVSVVHTVSFGSHTTTVTVRWTLNNDGATVNGSKWLTLLEASYNGQGKPQPQSYAGGKG